MGVAVADDLEVEVVGVPAAGQHRVQLLPGLLPGQQAVHGVGGDALGRMDGGRVPETGRGAHIVDRQPDGELAARVSDDQVAVFRDMSDHPAVPVLDPVRAAEAESTVVAAGDDHISDTGPVPVGQTHLGRRSGVIKTMLPGAAVELRDQLTGGGDHDRVEARRAIRNPSVERILGRGRYVADVKTGVIKVEVECLRFTLAEGE